MVLSTRCTFRMDRKTLSEDLLRAIRSWDEKLRQEIESDNKPASWQVLEFVRFFEMASVHSRLVELTPADFDYRNELTRFWGCYLHKIGLIKEFEVGEKVGNNEGEECQIQIDSFNEDYSRIKLTIVRSTDFWKSRGLEEDKQIELRKVHDREDIGYDNWVPTDPLLPWFTLSIGVDGKKSFEHYR